MNYSAFMQTFTESNLNFTFSDAWEVIKYDEHRYYRALSGSDFSGVDFAGIHDGKAYFIEVKNYTQYPMDEPLNLEEITQNFTEKITDTQRLLALINQYHERKWLYRLVRNQNFLMRRFFKHWYFWKRLFEFTPYFIFYIHCADHDLKGFYDIKNRLILSHRGSTIQLIINQPDELTTLGIGLHDS